MLPPNVELREIAGDDEPGMQTYASALHDFSWGLEFPVPAINVVRAADYRVNAFHVANGRATWIAGGAITHTLGYPNKPNSELMFLCGAVVHPDWRDKRLYTALCVDRRKQLKRLRRPEDRYVHASVDHLHLEHVLTKQPMSRFGRWELWEPATNEDESDANVWRWKIRWF